MGRLIDADAFKDYALENIDVVVDGENLIEPSSTIENYFLNHPPIDPIHVAGGCYCRECAWGNPTIAEGGRIYCQRILTLNSPDNFCSSGKIRKKT